MTKGKVERKENCLVTGALGFNGLFMVERLVEEGYCVRATDLPGLDTSSLPDGVEFIPSDITDEDGLDELLEGIGWVFHPAALFDYTAPWEKLEKVNVHGTKNLCEAALEAKVKRFVLWSTIGVYDPGESGKPTADENAEKKPMNIYEKSKYEAEKIAFGFHEENGLPLTVMRPAPVYGPRSRYGVLMFMLRYAELPFFPIPVNLKSRFTTVHVKDVCGAALFLAKNPDAIGEAYNLIDDSNMSIKGIAHFTAALFGKPTIPVLFPLPLAQLGLKGAAEISHFIAKASGTRPYIERDLINYFKYDYVFSNAKIKKLGFEFQYPDIRLGLPETVAWYRENGFVRETFSLYA